MEKKLLKKVSTIAEKLKRALWMIIHRKQQRSFFGCVSADSLETG